MKLLSFIVLVATALVASVSGDQLMPKCSATANIIFHLIKPKSVTQNDWRYMKQFMRNMIELFDVGPSKVRFGVVLKAKNVHLMFGLNRFPTRKALLKAVDELKCQKCKNQDKKGYGLKKSMKLALRNKDTKGRKNIVIVLTDGQMRIKKNKFKQNARSLKNKATVFAVGIGGSVRGDHLHTIATGKNGVFRVNAFRLLHSIRIQLANMICNAVQGSHQVLPPPPPPPQVIPWVLPPPEVFPPPVLPLQKKCDVPLDLLILMDKSASLSKKHFRMTQEFVASMLGEFNIHPDKVRVSIVLFAIKHHNMFCFAKHTTKQALTTAVMNLKCPKCRRGKTGTGDALQFGREHSFKAKCGSRPGAKKVVVIFTDGKSTEKQQYLRLQAMKMKTVANEVIAVGIGKSNKIDRKELQLLASDNDFVFMINDFSLLKGQLGPITEKTCHAAEKCDAPIDLLLLLDKSASVSKKQFKQAQKFVRNLIGKFDIHADSVRVSVVIFAIKHHNMFCFNKYTTRHELQTAVMNLKCPKCKRGKTGTGDALQFGREHSFKAKCGSRPDAKKVVVILTDGRSTEKQSYLKEQAHLMKKTADEVLAVGIGKKKKIDRKELELLATRKKYVFMVNDYVQLGGQLNAITTKTCEAGRPIDKDDCMPKPCKNGGVCKDLVNSFSCVCRPGFTGKDCGIDIDNCASRPCKNGGVCDDLVNDFSCDCRPGFSGKDCGIDIDDCAAWPCKNGGVCKDMVNDFSCTCKPGFTGKDCGIDIDHCAGKPCQNGALCNDLVDGFSCTCKPGYTGKECGVDIDHCAPRPCKNGGVCKDLVNGFSCSCRPGYIGKDCGVDIDHCAPKPCKNGGVCKDLISDFSCECPLGFTGRDCGIDIDHCLKGPCKNGGVCVDKIESFLCKCKPGFSGKDCGIDIDNCAPKPCMNGGVCTDLVNDFSCKCPAGYTGKDCGIDINECLRAPGPCKNGGLCTDLVNGFACKCATGFSGKDCSTMDCPPTPTLTLSTDNVLKGGEVKLICASSFEGKLSYRFYLNGKEIHSGPDSVYLIASASSAHIGAYTCEAFRGGLKCGQSTPKKLAVMDKCNVPIDLLLLLDRSASVSNAQFEVALKFVKNMMGKFDIGLNKVRVSTVLFAIKHHNMFCFTEHTTMPAVQSAIAGLKCPNCRPGLTGTGDALQYGREHSFTAACGSRPGVKRIVFILTDGRSTEPRKYLENQAKLMKETADEVIAVGIGSKHVIDRNELELLASDKSLVVMINNFALLDAQLDAISSKTCLAGSG